MVLDFGGRVKKASARNFQLCAKVNSSLIILASLALPKRHNRRSRVLDPVILFS